MKLIFLHTVISRDTLELIYRSNQEVLGCRREAIFFSPDSVRKEPPILRKTGEKNDRSNFTQINLCLGRKIIFQKTKHIMITFEVVGMFHQSIINVKIIDKPLEKSTRLHYLHLIIDNMTCFQQKTYNQLSSIN